MQQVKVISVGLEPPTNSTDTVSQQLDRMEIILAALDSYHADFICFPEICLHTALPLKAMLQHAEPVPGPSTERLADHCRKLNIHLLLPLLESDAGRVYNTVVLLDRSGTVVGKYRKFQPTSYEMADGIYPGEEVPVWPTDSGRIGISVCFDMKFPEVGLALSRGNAQLVFWPTMFRGGQRLNAWARDYGFHLVSCGVWGGKILDPRGQLLAESLFPTEIPQLGPVPIVQSVLNVDCKSYHLDYNKDKLPAVLGKYGSGLQAFLMDDEGIFTLTSLMPDRTVEQVEAEFDLEDLRSYLDRAIADRTERI